MLKGTGKFLLGPPTDKFGGANTLKITMLLVALLLQFMAVSPNVLVFGRMWIVLSFVYAAGTFLPSCKPIYLPTYLLLMSLHPHIYHSLPPIA